MRKEYVMGNEAIALGALAAGVNVVAGYPGTPSTEVLETIARRRGETTYVEWSVNEKAAMELVAGAAYSGARALVTMKQVGLNVASDPLMSLEYVGVKGGLVILVADDPGPISSQTEQDTRHFAAFSKVPCFDPSSAEEAYQMVQEAFRISEEYGTPVILRPTTRVCHGYASLDVKEPEEYEVHTPEGFTKDSKRWVIFPRLSFANHQKIFARNEKLSEVFSTYEGNSLRSFGAKEVSVVAEPAEGETKLPAVSEEGGTKLPAVSEEGNAILSAVTVVEKREKGTCLGIAASGISYAYALESLEKLEGSLTAPVQLFKVSTPYPFPEQKAEEFLRACGKVLVLEELDPVVEDSLIHVAGQKNLPVQIFGKNTHTTTVAGENTRDSVDTWIRGFVEASLKKEGGLQSVLTGAAASVSAAITAVGKEPDQPELPVRPPVLCAGCPHRASFYAVKQAMKGKKTVFCGDIGCYTLGNAMPLDMVDTCLCMGAGVNMAQGFGRVEPDTTCFAFVGDSTFFASAITGVVNAVYNQANMTLIILDNSTTAMTGHQPHPGTGHTMMGEVVAKVNMEQVLRGVGVKTVETVNPLCYKEAVETVTRVAAEPGVKAIIFKYPCIAMASDQAKHLREVGPVRILPEKCIQCKKCIRELGCPALILKDGKVAIDETLCTGCGLCRQICPTGAIEGGDNPEDGVQVSDQPRLGDVPSEEGGEFHA